MKSQSPFLDAFREAVHPDFVPSALTESTKCHPMLSEPELKKLARCYSCSSRTLRRMEAKGVDVTDASAVACHLANQKSISLEMAEAVLSHLEKNPSND